MTYEAAARIQAAGLHVAAMTDDSVTVAWLSLGDAPASWHIAAAGPDYAQETDVTDATATFTGVRRDAAYTFTLTADGLDAPITLELPANAPTVTSFTAAASGAGAIQAQWAYDGEMADGWQVEYTASGSDALLSTAKTAQQVVTLQQVAPNCSYIVRLLGPDGGALIGPTVTQVQTPAAENYTGHGSPPGLRSWRPIWPCPARLSSLQDLGEAQTEFGPGRRPVSGPARSGGLRFDRHRPGDGGRCWRCRRRHSRRPGGDAHHRRPAGSERPGRPVSSPPLACGALCGRMASISWLCPAAPVLPAATSWKSILTASLPPMRFYRPAKRIKLVK